MELNSSNYYTPEANAAYWSASLVKEFLDCPARAYAELMGRYERPKSTALIVGSYVDAFFEGTLDDFKRNNRDIFKRDGSLKSDYIAADRMIERATSDPVFMEYMG